MVTHNVYEDLARSSPKNATSPLNGSEKPQYVNGQDHTVKRTDFYNPSSLPGMCDALRRKSQQKNYKKLSEKIAAELRAKNPLTDQELTDLTVAYQYEFGDRGHPYRPACDPSNDPKNDWSTFGAMMSGPLFFPQNDRQGQQEFYLWEAVLSYFKKTGGLIRTDTKAIKTGEGEIKIADQDKHFMSSQRDSFLRLLMIGNNQTRERYGCGLTLYEKEVFNFIRARTLGYGKLIEIIPQRHFLEGVFDPQGNMIQAPCAISCHKMIKKAKEGLKRRGEITEIPLRFRKGKGGKSDLAYMPLSRTMLCHEIACRLSSLGLLQDFFDYLSDYKNKNGQHLSPWQRRLISNLFNSSWRCTGAAWLERQNGKLSDMAFGLSSALGYPNLGELREDLHETIEIHTLTKSDIQYFVPHFLQNNTN